MKPSFKSTVISKVPNIITAHCSSCGFVAQLSDYELVEDFENAVAKHVIERRHDVRVLEAHNVVERHVEFVMEKV